MSLLLTPSQTVGPYFALGLERLYSDRIAAPTDEGHAVRVGGRILDADGQAVPDAVVELWQADSLGRYAEAEDPQDASQNRAWRGFGRVPTDANGRFGFSTVKPGSVRGPGSTMQAPHIVVLLGMRGLLRHLMTRMYFPDEPRNGDDPILGLVPAERRQTLVAKAVSDDVLDWDIHLQGPLETVFFDY